MLLLCFVYAGAIFPPEPFRVVDDVGHADPCSGLRLSNAADEHSHGLFCTAKTRPIGVRCFERVAFPRRICAGMGLPRGLR